jgi:hypothetical protein
MTARYESFLCTSRAGFGFFTIPRSPVLTLRGVSRTHQAPDAIIGATLREPIELECASVSKPLA